MIVSVFPGGFRVSCSKCGETTKLYTNFPMSLREIAKQDAKLSAGTVKIECFSTDTEEIADDDLATLERVK